MDELFALPGKPGKRVEEDEEFPELVHKKANEWASEPGMTRKQAYGKAIGMYKSGDLKEVFPHGGLPYGAARKQNGEKEHAGHVERSCHQGLRNVMNEEDNPHIQAIQDIGFSNIEYISKGLYGSVYRGTWDNHDGVEHAIKVLPANGDGRHEAKVYRTISDMRSKVKSIAKHFPRVDMVRMDQKRNLILIVMELLENDPNAKGVIQDIFGGTEVAVWRPDLALQDLDIHKNIGHRADMMITDPKTKEFVVNKLIQTVPAGKGYVKDALMRANFRGMKFPKLKWQNAIGKMKQNAQVFDLVDVIWDDMKTRDLGPSKESSGKTSIAFLAYFLNAAVEAWEKDFDVEKMGYDALFDELYLSLEDFIHMYRSWTPIGISPDGSTDMMKGAPPEIKGAGYPGTESLLKAIKAVRATTGLGAYDMHDDNVLVRPGTKDLVIVDVGLFREKSARIKSPDKQVTALGEVNKKDFLRVIIQEIQKFNLT